MSSQIGKAGGVHGRFVGGSAVRGCPGRPGGAPVLPRGRLQGRHRRPARHQPVPGGPAARFRPRGGNGTYRDRPARGQPGRGPVSGAVLGIRAQARLRVQLPRRGRGGAAAPAGRSRGPGADGPHHARRRPRHVLVAHAERAGGLAHPAPAVPDRPAHRGGPAHVFYAPMILDDAQTAAAIRRQGDIADAFALLPSVTIAVVALGAWAPGLSTIYDAVTPDERNELAALGVRAELAGVFVGADGRPVPTPLDSRMIVTPGPVLERIPFVLSVAYGVAKSPAVCAAIRGRLVHGLVTHASLAREMLSAYSRGDDPPGDPPDHGRAARPSVPPRPHRGGFQPPCAGGRDR